MRPIPAVMSVTNIRVPRPLTIPLASVAWDPNVNFYQVLVSGEIPEFAALGTAALDPSQSEVDTYRPKSITTGLSLNTQIG